MSVLPASRRTEPLAKGVSDVLGPLPVTVALCAAGVRHSSTWAAGIGWGLVAILFSAILPYVATWRIRHPADGSLPASRARVTYMAVAALTAAVGLVVIHVLGGPWEVIRATVSILITLVITAAVNARWRWSNHVSACAAGVTLLVAEVGETGLLAAAAVIAVAWARLSLQRHDRAQLLGGLIIGALGVLASLLVIR